MSFMKFTFRVIYSKKGKCCIFVSAGSLLKGGMN